MDIKFSLNNKSYKNEILLYAITEFVLSFILCYVIFTNKYIFYAIIPFISLMFNLLFVFFSLVLSSSLFEYDKKQMKKFKKIHNISFVIIIILIITNIFLSNIKQNCVIVDNNGLETQVVDTGTKIYNDIVKKYNISFFCKYKTSNNLYYVYKTKSFQYKNQTYTCLNPMKDEFSLYDNKVGGTVYVNNKNYNIYSTEKEAE